MLLLAAFSFQKQFKKTAFKSSLRGTAGVAPQRHSTRVSGVSDSASLGIQMFPTPISTDKYTFILQKKKLNLSQLHFENWRL